MSWAGQDEENTLTTGDVAGFRVLNENGKRPGVVVAVGVGSSDTVDSQAFSYFPI